MKLDKTTAKLVAQLAKTWGVSEQEAVRRAVHQANVANRSLNTGEWLEAFKELQLGLGLTPRKASAWNKAIRDARR